MRKFLKGFSYAFEGIMHGLKTERNIRFHCSAAFIVIIVSFLSKLSPTEWCVIILLIGGMIALEYINSAIERAVDLTISTTHPLAKQAKDLAAAAVLIYAAVSVCIGLIIFVPKWFTKF